MEDVRTNTRYRLREVFGADAFYHTLEDVVKLPQTAASGNVSQPDPESFMNYPG
jgi:hypothetical protein